MALPVVLAGVLCVLDDSWFPRALGRPPLTHTVFAALLCGWVVAEWYSRPRRTYSAVADDLNFTRDLTLRMYLMLYVIVGVGQLFGLISLRYGGTFHRPDVSFLGIALMGLLLARAPRYIMSRRDG